jgi:hypothetical protein
LSSINSDRLWSKKSLETAAVGIAGRQRACKTLGDKKAALLEEKGSFKSLGVAFF